MSIQLGQKLGKIGRTGADTAPVSHDTTRVNSAGIVKRAEGNWQILTRVPMFDDMTRVSPGSRNPNFEIFFYNFGSLSLH